MFRNFTKYEVFDDGRIWSYKTKRFLKPITTKYGYKRVGLYDNEGNIKLYHLHRIVYEAVTGSPIPEGMQVNHINEDKTDNKFSNLNLMSPKENTNFGTCIERRAKTNTNNPKHSKTVGAFKNGELVMSFPSTNEAGRKGFNQSAVASCCRGEKKTYKGYTWKYI